MGFAKTWYAITCSKHGVKPKGQSYGEIIVPAPAAGSKMLGRHRTECPLCKQERLKAEKGE